MIRVMIVEDQKLVRSLLESYILNEEGYRLAVSIPGAAEAPILCDTEDIDLILMDVQTAQRENGLTAAEKIHKAHPNIKIVVVTSLIDHEILKRAKAVGVDSLWYKDGDEGTLMQVVRSTMQGAHIFPDAPPSVKNRSGRQQRVHPGGNACAAPAGARAVVQRHRAGALRGAVHGEIPRYQYAAKNRAGKQIATCHRRQRSPPCGGFYRGVRNAARKI